MMRLAKKLDFQHNTKGRRLHIDQEDKRGNMVLLSELREENPSSETWGMWRICYVQTKKTGWDKM